MRITTTRIVSPNGRISSRNSTQTMNTSGQVFTKVDMENAELTHSKRLIAYHQLEAYSLYLEDKPAELAAYRKFLVSVFSMVLACIIIAMIIISHHHSAGALQSRGYCQQGAWAANDFHSTGEIRVGSGNGKGSCHGYGGRRGA